MKSETPSACQESFDEFLSQGDLDSIVDLFDESAALVTEDGTVMRGRGTLRELLAPFVNDLSDAARTYRIVPVSDDLVVVYHEWRSEIDADEGRVPVTGAGIQILRQHGDGRWRIVFDDPTAMVRGD